MPSHEIQVDALPDAEVLVFRNASFGGDMAKHLQDELRKKGRKPLIIGLDGDATLETLDRQQMRAAGWMRVEDCPGA